MSKANTLTTFPVVFPPKNQIKVEEEEGEEEEEEGEGKEGGEGWKEEEEHFERIYACAFGHGGMGHHGNFYFIFCIFKISGSVFTG